MAAAGTSDLANACHQLAAMLEQTGFNHGAAESASTPGGPPPDTTNYLTAPWVGVPATPSANGGSVDPLSGWGLIESAVGYLWPNGDAAKLGGAGRAWSSAASSLRVAAASVPEAVTGIQSQRSPEVTGAVAVCQAMGQHIGEVAGGCGDLAKACSDYADHLEKAHQDIIEELVELVAWTVAIEAAGALGSLITVGIAEGGAQLAEAGRIGRVAQRLKPILGARLAKATTEAAEKLPAEAKDAEATAEETLQKAQHRTP